jgi:hypothetical protein
VTWTGSKPDMREQHAQQASKPGVVLAQVLCDVWATAQQQALLLRQQVHWALLQLPAHGHMERQCSISS